MRLINTRTRHFEEFMGTDIPKYATLSHTWGRQEVSFKEMSDPSIDLNKEGYRKIDKTCEIAAKAGIQYVWVDTCCIDKLSSAELTEAINSMYNWYRRSAVCYAYLSDLDLADGECLNKALQGCRWFKRGWTLQELIAPKHVIFFDKGWVERGTKDGLVGEISAITGISTGILLGEQQLSSMSVAQKMSWASKRQTTRVEDTAYCLLGIFEVNMPLLYGEEHRAFRRLQEEILSRAPELSIFAWRRPSSSDREQSELRQYCGVLADSPSLFVDCGNFVRRRTHVPQQVHASNGYITTRMQILIELLPETGGYRYVLPLDCSQDANTMLGVRLRKYGPNEFVRENPDRVESWDRRVLFRSSVEKQRYLLADMDTVPQPPAELGPGTHYFVGQQRPHALRLKVPPEMRHPLYSVWPGHRFDGEDIVFYISEEEFDSATMRLVGSLSPPAAGAKHSNIAFEILFCALGWASLQKETLQCSLLDSRLHSAALTEYKSTHPGLVYIRQHYLQHLVYHGIPKVSSIGIPIMGTDSSVRVWYEATVAEDRTVCRNPFWTIEFFCEFYHGGETPPVAKAEEWKVDTPLDPWIDGHERWDRTGSG